MSRSLSLSCAFLFLVAVASGAEFEEKKKNGKYALVFFKDGVTWFDGKDHCMREYGSPLAVPHTDAENKEVNGWKAENIWVGAHDFARESVFAAVDGFPLLGSDYEGGVLPWGAGEPNNAGSGESCVHMRADGFWNDLNCDAKIALLLCGAPVQWKPLFKAMRGKEVGSSFSFANAFHKGPSTPDAQKYLEHFHPETVDDKVKFFRSPQIDHWEEAVAQGGFDRVKVSFYKNGEQAAYFVYSASPDAHTWFGPHHYLDSSYMDVQSFAHLEKQWGMTSAWAGRDFVVWGNAGGCSNDKAWALITTFPACGSWGEGNGEVVDGFPTIWFSGTRQAALLDSVQAQRGDTLVIFVGHSASQPPEPAYQTCDKPKHTLDWEALFLGKSPVSEETELTTARKDKNGQIAVTVTVVAPYLMGSSYHSQAALYEGVSPGGSLGVTYVLDTAEFESEGRLLADAHNCENRVKSDFDARNFVKDYFHYSQSPSDPEALGSRHFLAYPPANVWDISMVDALREPCGDIQYEHTFSFDELKQCHGFSFKDSGSALVLEGAVYLAAVSPLPWALGSSTQCVEHDCGQYVTYTLESHPITISFAKSVSVIKTSGAVKISLFTSHVISATYDEDIDTFSMVLITSVPNFMSLNIGTAMVVSPKEADLEAANHGDDFLDGALKIWEVNGAYGGKQCLIKDEYRCFQKFAITAKVKNCDKKRLFDGDYYFSAEFTCAAGKEALCQDYLTGTPSHPKRVTMDSVKLEYTEGCDRSAYAVRWDGEIVFFRDATFKQALLPKEAVYAKGDTVFVRVSIAGVAAYPVIGMRMATVFLCSSDSGKLPEGGCLASTEAGVHELRYNVMKDEGLKFKLIHGDPKQSFKDFSFSLPVIADNTFLLHIDVVFDILPPSPGMETRRRLLQMSVEPPTEHKEAMSRFQEVLAIGHMVDSHNGRKGNKPVWLYLALVAMISGIVWYGLRRGGKGYDNTADLASNERMPLLAASYGYYT